MPWKEVTPMEEITRFVMQAQSDRFTITELCEQFGISRKTGYRHLERYTTGGLKGLQELSPGCLEDVRREGIVRADGLNLHAIAVATGNRSGA